MAQFAFSTPKFEQLTKKIFNQDSNGHERIELWGRKIKKSL